MVVGGDTAAEFANNANAVLGPNGAAELRAQFFQLIPAAPPAPAPVASAPAPTPAPALATPTDPFGQAVQTVTDAFPGASIQQQRPAPAGPPPGSGAGPPLCAHGPRKWVTSKPDASKPWKAWMCSAQKDDPSKCEPQWA